MRTHISYFYRNICLASTFLLSLSNHPTLGAALDLVLKGFAHVLGVFDFVNKSEFCQPQTAKIVHEFVLA